MLSVSGAAASDISWPDFPEHLDDLLIEAVPAADIPSALLTAPDTPVKVYRLTALKSGVWKLPARTLKLKQDGQEISLTVPSILYEAQPLPEGTMPKIDDLEDPVSPVSLLRSKFRWWIGLVGLAAVAMIAFFLWYYRTAARKPVPAAPMLPPWETALRRLEELRRRNWPILGKVELYYVDLSAILRYYIQDRFGINAPDMTTQECVEAMRSAGLDSTGIQKLEDLLRHFDRVKFAGLVPGVPEMEARLEAAAEFVRQTIPDQQTEPAAPGKPEKEDL